MQREATQREPTPLPILTRNKRSPTLEKYAARLWRETQTDKIIPIIEKLYEEAYSAGLIAKGKMELAVERKPKKYQSDEKIAPIEEAPKQKIERQKSVFSNRRPYDF